MNEARDLTIDNQIGDHIEHRRVGYYPEDHSRYPGAKDSWAVLCTVPGARGPIHERRGVSYTAWVPDA